MDRLQTELQRLYFSQDAAADAARAFTLEVTRPASWDVLKKVWQGVQADLDLPAPAIAVSGVDALQLWFSFAQAVPVVQAAAFLETLRRRYLGDVPPDRVRMHPWGALPHDAGQAAPPPTELAPDRWSAFVAPDLAALFVDEPWLDMPPGRDAQADLLSRIACTKADDFLRALERLRSADVPAPLQAGAAPGAQHADPRSFLLATMNDAAVDMRFRVEAAKALLPYFENPEKKDQA
ncbi:MAG TPA: hypothetical protein VLJ86_18420 [Ramlibacter sp.]|nr:hypothetical protein [Ramlibacter sp.]